MKRSPEFGVFDPRAEVDISHRHLPHWFQPGVAVFITFRTADSMPAEVLKRWEREQADWLQRNTARLKNPSDVAARRFGETSDIVVPAELEREFQQFRWRSWHGRLDECHGECVLRRPELSQIVGECLRQFDGQRYDLDSFVVMPNHVHLLVQFRPEIDFRRQCGNWQRYTARRINSLLHRRGPFWQSEPFDHLVRSPEQFDYLRRYVAENPVKADLAPGTYLSWRRDP